MVGMAAVILLIASSTISSHMKTAAPITAASAQDISLDEVFAHGLASVNEERRTNHAAEFGCTERFSDFRDIRRSNRTSSSSSEMDFNPFR
jgi:hypothetical protein